MLVWCCVFSTKCPPQLSRPHLAHCEKEGSRGEGFGLIAGTGVQGLSAADGRRLRGRLRRGEDKGNNETVKAEGLAEDEDEDDADVHEVLLAYSTDTGIGSDPNGKARAEAGEAAAEPSGKELVPGIHGLIVAFGFGNTICCWCAAGAVGVVGGEYGLSRGGNKKK